MVLKITKNGNKYSIKSTNMDSTVYLNDIQVYEKSLENGDIVFIYGYKIIPLSKYLIIQSSNKVLRINTPSIVPCELPQYTGEILETEEDDNATIYNDNDYYSRSPRFVTSIIEENIKIDNPPGKITPDETPVLYTIGPMLTMSMSSIVSAAVSIMNLKNNNSGIMSSLPAIFVSVAMLASTLLWPTLMKKYNKKKSKKEK